MHRMPISLSTKLLYLTFCLLALSWTASAGTVEKVISREQREMDVTGKQLSVGRNGYVYVINPGYVMRFNRDGTGKIGFRPSYATINVAANDKGILAAASAHMDMAVRLYGQKHEELAAVKEFQGSDKIGWYAPSDIQVGPSGDFYAPDQHRGRIVRIDAAGKKVAEYPLAETGENYTAMILRMRVAEPQKRFYLACGGPAITALDFDGKKLWAINAGVSGHPQTWKAYEGDFDADDAGNLYVLRSMTDTIDVYDKDGKPTDKIKLDMGDLKGQGLTLRVCEDEIFVKREHKTELFQVYDRKTGKIRKVVHADVEIVQMDAPDVWTAGQAVPVALTVEAAGKKNTPNWPVHIALLNDSQFKALPIVDGKITVPADASGLYHVQVGHGEYKLDTVVEIRKPGSLGTVNILTPLNRVYYGRGEDIPVTVIVRGGDANTPGKVAVTLRDRQARTEVLRFAGQDLKWNAAVGTLSIPAATTAKLRPGRYLLTVAVDGMTVAPQVLVIGPGLRERPIFNIVQGGDGAHPLVDGGMFDAPTLVAGQVVRSERLGINMFIDRLGDMVDTSLPPAETAALVARLKLDPLGVAPEKAQVENVNLHAIAARGAFGIEQQSVLMHMDSMLPFLKEGEPGPGGWLAYYHASTGQKIVKEVTARMAAYPALRGWTWACNWWFDYERAFKSINSTKEAWPALRKTVLDTGTWDPEVDRFSDVVINLIPDADRSLNAALQEVAPGKVNAVTGPYRQPGIVPAVSFAGAKEIDLFCQAEQIQFPFMTPHNVDFYKRPGKRAFGHVETFNETGSGGMVLPIILQQVIRGADGTGWEGELPANPHHRQGGITGTTPGSSEDVRSLWQGQLSVFRAMNGLLKSYGPWLTTLQSADRVAIVVSTRMLRLDYWEAHMGGLYFQRLFEAYTACLYAHRPASFVFVEDLKDDTLKKYKALLVVGQRVELEPALAKALADAQAAGVAVFYDGTCRPEHVQAFKPLSVSFDNAEKEPGLMNVDVSYYNLPKHLREEAGVLIKAMESLVAPVAAVDNPEIMLTERRNGEGRFVWALNNDLSDWEPHLMWRLGSYASHRVPQAVPIKLDAKNETIYEVFSMQQVQADTVADLRSMPVRLYAILPKPIESVTVTAADRVTAGENLAWELAINGPKMSYPVRLRLIDADGTVLEETFPIKAGGAITVPVNAGPTVTLEAIELITGKSAQRKIQVDGGVAAKRDSASQQGLEQLPAERLFGPHLRDIAVSADGSAALVNAMDWTDNYYVLDTNNGTVRGQGSVGHHYAYGPQAGGNGFFVQGYDVTTPEGYHLYDLGQDGKASRRIATYGLPQRHTLWFGSMFVDHVNNFVVSPTGQWVANAGNLGMIVWSKDGKKLWSLDWWKTTRQQMFLLAQGEDTLITLTGMTMTAYKAISGQKLWDVTLADTGELQGGSVSADGQTIAVWSDTWGGRVYVVRDGKPINTFFALPDNINLTPDGKHLAVNIRRDVRWYATDGGLEWVFTGDDWLHNVRIAPDGKKLLVGSDLGVLYILDDQGKTLFERDFGASPVAKWLKDGELLVATWQGDVIRLNADGSEKWKVRLGSKGPSRLQAAPLAEKLTTLRPEWRNELDKPRSLDSNLLRDVKAIVRVTDDRVPTYVYLAHLESLTDGQPTPPMQPWLTWHNVAMAESGWVGKIVIDVESPQSQLSVEAVTFVEDPDHPESWLRNMVMQVWDPAKKAWADCPPLLSDSATHTHTFTKPLVGSRFRFLGDLSVAWLPGHERAGLGGVGWPVGNIRLGEIVFHGKAIAP